MVEILFAVSTSNVPVFNFFQPRGQSLLFVYNQNAIVISESDFDLS